MRNKLLPVVGLCMLLFSACNKDATEATPTTATVNLDDLERKDCGPVSRPFKGSLSYTFAPESNLPCDCGSYYPAGTFYGSGNLTQLGKTTSHIKPCVSPIIKNGTQIGDRVGVECAYFKAANGDSVYCYTHPYDLIYGPTGAVGYATVDFTGGTGRFKKATGSFTGKVTVSATGATFTNIKGTIAY